MAKKCDCGICQNSDRKPETEVHQLPNYREIETANMDIVIGHLKKKFSIDPFLKETRKVEGAEFMAVCYGTENVKWVTFSFMADHMLALTIWMEGRKIKCGEITRLLFQKEDWKSMVEGYMKEMLSK